MFYKVNDTVKLKKKHPCGSDTFKVIYCASDVKLECTSCKRSITMPRIKVDKYFKETVNNV